MTPAECTIGRSGNWNFLKIACIYANLTKLYFFCNSNGRHMLCFLLHILIFYWTRESVAVMSVIICQSCTEEMPCSVKMTGFTLFFVPHAYDLHVVVCVRC